EGEFKALALTQELIPTIGLTGIRAWQPKGEQRLLPALEAIKWRGRDVYLVPDSDIATNPNVESAVAWLGKHLADRGAKVRVTQLPDAEGGGKLGIDDWLVLQGDNRKAALRKLLDDAIEPPTIEPETLKLPAKHADPSREAASFLLSGKID